jgi:hypothetical protein
MGNNEIPKPPISPRESRPLKEELFPFHENFLDGGAFSNLLNSKQPIYKLMMEGGLPKDVAPPGTVVGSFPSLETVAEKMQESLLTTEPVTMHFSAFNPYPSLDLTKVNLPPHAPRTLSEPTNFFKMRSEERAFILGLEVQPYVPEVKVSLPALTERARTILSLPEGGTRDLPEIKALFQEMDTFNCRGISKALHERIKMGGAILGLLVAADIGYEMYRAYWSKPKNQA